MRDFSAGKSLDCCSHPRSRSSSTSLSTSLSLLKSSVLSSSSQTSVGIAPSQTCTPQTSYFPNFSHCIDINDNIRIIHQELSRPKYWVSPPVSIYFQKEPVGLPTMDISMIGAAPFNFLVQKASLTKDIQIFSFLIRDIEKTLAPRFTINPAKKLPIKYYDFLKIFSHADSDKLPLHRSYNHKISLIEGKTPLWGPLYNMS